VEEEIYTHEYLWRSASMLVEKAEAEEQASYHLLLPALMMSFLAFEAFVNFCGFVLLPELWREEKRHFKGKRPSRESSEHSRNGFPRSHGRRGSGPTKQSETSKASETLLLMERCSHRSILLNGRKTAPSSISLWQIPKSLSNEGI
jgi:hypothetical protein